VLDALLLAALLSVTDPPGDALGLGLSAPTATLMRQRDAFDVRSLAVLDQATLTLELTLGRAGGAFPQGILEVYVSDAEAVGTRGLLPGSQLQLPPGASWRYAARIVGERVQVFSGEGGTPRDVTEAGRARLEVSVNTLLLTTDLPLPRRFSVYGMSGSYDPFSPHGWRTLREAPSPWGFSGAAPSPVLDVIAESPVVQARALEGGVLPEIRASFARPGWLVVAGVGVVIALAGVTARFTFGRRTDPVPPAAYLAPFTEGAVRHRTKTLEALAEGRGVLIPVSNPESSAPPEPVMK